VKPNNLILSYRDDYGPWTERDKRLSLSLDS
jgi:hypothetical protein